MHSIQCALLRRQTTECTLRWTVPTAGAFGLGPALHWTRAARPKAAGTRICALCATQTQLARSFDPRPGRACRGNSPKPQPSAALDACSTRCGCCRATFIAALDASQMRRAGARHATSHAASSAVLDASSTRRGWRHAAGAPMEAVRPATRHPEADSALGGGCTVPESKVPMPRCVEPAVPRRAQGSLCATFLAAAGAAPSRARPGLPQRAKARTTPAALPATSQRRPVAARCTQVWH